MASEVITLLYGRGLGVALAPVRPPATESRAPRAPPGVLVSRTCPPAEGEGAAGGDTVRAHAEKSRTEANDSILYRMWVRCGFNETFQGHMNFTLRNREPLTMIGLLALGTATIGCPAAPAMHVEEAIVAEVAETPVIAATEPALVPAPARAEMSRAGRFVLASGTSIHVDPAEGEALEVANQLARLIPLGPGQPRSVSAALPGTAIGPGIHLLLDGSLDALGEEGYRLTISPERITAWAARPAGLFYAVQTLRQLLPAEAERGTTAGSFAIGAGEIVDSPRFQWRGAMLDVSRHFLKPADVKRYVDHMALYKLNRLHLHLSDDQGWRIEIKSWPNLTAHGGSTAVGGGPGGFYTQAEYKDIVKYARARFITVVPEIDMPGHTNAALASYPQLNCDGRAPALYTGTRVGFSSLCPAREVTYRFVDDVVREIGALTPGRWFHVGGDEVKTLSAAQYAAFVERVQSIVRSRGKEMIGWDEIGAAKLHPTTIVQYWRPDATARDAIAQGNRFILSPANKVYLDMKYDASTALGLKWAGYVEVRTSYDWDPSTRIPGVSETSIVGIEAPLWSETVVTIADFEHMAFPRLAAVAEVAWSPQHRRDWDDFRLRLAAQGPRWEMLGINFYRSPQVLWK